MASVPPNVNTRLSTKPIRKPPVPKFSKTSPPKKATNAVTTSAPDVVSPTEQSAAPKDKESPRLEETPTPAEETSETPLQEPKAAMSEGETPLPTSAPQDHDNGNGKEGKTPEPTIRKGNPANGVQRGMELLAESHMAENLQEVKQLDTQLTHLNEKVDEMEKRIETHHNKIQGMLDEQKATRLERKTSFTQRMEETKAADNDWDRQVQEMLGRVAQQRAFKPNPQAQAE